MARRTIDLHGLRESGAGIRNRETRGGHVELLTRLLRFNGRFDGGEWLRGVRRWGRSEGVLEGRGFVVVEVVD